MLEKKRELWGITTFFNPVGYKNKKINYSIFRESSKKQGLKLLTVELAFDDRPFELVDTDADKIIQIRTKKDNILWQKEALLNIGLKNLPNDCDKVVWVDCDIIFENENWVDETSKKLDKYCVVQPYSYSIKMCEGITKIKDHTKIPFGLEEMKYFHGIAYGVSQKGYGSLKEYIEHGHVGFVWAIRRKILDKIGFYDSAITGSGDLIMAGSFFNSQINYFKKKFSTKMIKHLENWSEKMSKEVKGSVYYIDGYIYHLWHGETKDRMYDPRHSILKNNDFDPDVDIIKDKNGIWEWSKYNMSMCDSLNKYFLERKEDRDFIDNNESIRICTSFDNNFIKYFFPMVNSILGNSHGKIIFYILSRNLSYEDKMKLLGIQSSRLTIKIINMDSFFKEHKFLLPNHIMSKSAMDRLLITSILKDIKKVIYLDVDLIVNSDISNLYNFDTGETGICARICNPGNHNRILGLVKVWGNNDFNILKYFPGEVDINNDKCFNSGVMLLDLDKMRENNFEQKMLKMISKYPLADQFLLNLYTNGKHTELPISWNYFPVQDHDKKVDKNIIHWIGSEKPWNSCPPLFEYWYRYSNDGHILFLKKIKQKIIYCIKDIFYFLDKKVGLIGCFIKKNTYFLFLS